MIVVHENGMRFAMLPDITAERHDFVHTKGTIVKGINSFNNWSLNFGKHTYCMFLGIEKVTEAASPLTLVRLQNDYGWLFESTLTGEVNYIIYMYIYIVYILLLVNNNFF